MKPAAIFIAALSVFATAHVARNPKPIPEPGSIEGLQSIIQQINAVPGIGAIKKMTQCIQKDKSWKVDYSDKKNGIVTFSSVSKKCCHKARAGWKKYGDKWSKFARASFNDPCDGGQFLGMTDENVEKLRAFIGNGH